MPAILLVLLLGTAINVANTHPQNMGDVRTELTKEIKHPILSAGGPYNK